MAYTAHERASASLPHFKERTVAIFSGTMDDILRGTPDMDVLWGGMGDDTRGSSGRVSA